MTAGPFNEAVERFNGAWNLLHADVCGRGLVPVDDELCVRVNKARDGWREFYHSAGAALVPWAGWTTWLPRYQKLRALALDRRIPTRAPEYVLTPVEQAAENVKRAAKKAANLASGYGEKFIIGALAVVVLSWAVSRSERRRLS